jgi:predicted AAA+ superfamily ATPase
LGYKTQFSNLSFPWFYRGLLNMAIARKLSATVHQALRQFPALVITGPRRAGKTTLLRKSVPKAQYVLLEDPDIQDRVRSDPRSFLKSLRLPVILDEIQNTPRLLDYARTLIDAQPRRMGQWLFTGSQEVPLMQGITESMAGRAAVLQLLPFSLAESPKVDMFCGGFPEPVMHPSSRELWYASYLQTYIERDVRTITQVRDLPMFRRFLSLLASRHGQFLNKSDLSASLGVAQSTIAEWLYVLEITNQIMLIQPYFENFGKRIIKSPKVYWGDSGMACHLLGIRTRAELERSPFLGPIFEGFVASEILKSQINLGQRKELYCFRDQQGLEVDFLVPQPNAKFWIIEAKAGRTVQSTMANPLLALKKAAADRVSRSLIIHRKARTQPNMTTVAPGVEAMPVEQFSALINP